MGNRINTIMQPCFFALSGVLPADEAIARIKVSVEDAYGRRGGAIVERNFAAIDAALDRLEQVTVPAEATSVRSIVSTVPDDAPPFVQKVTALLMAGDGDLLPVSAMPVDGTFPTGTARYEKRAIAKEIPIWDPDICIDCGKCAIVCPHATIRMKVFVPETVADAPADFLSKEFRSKDLTGHRLDYPGGTGRLHRLRCVRRRVPGQVQDRGTPQSHQHGTGARPSRHRAASVGLLLVDPSARPRSAAPRQREGLPGARAAVRVLRCVCRVRRDALHQARHPAVR